jgi:hypothetical protein
MQNNDILTEAIAEAKTLRRLSMSNAKHSLVKFLKEEKLPLDDLADAELDLDHFVDLIIKRSRERDEEEDELNQRGEPYLNCKHKLHKTDNEDELDERRWFTDDDEFEIDYGDGNVEKSGKDDEDEDEIDDKDDRNADDKEAEDNFSDDVIAERSRKWKNLYGRRNFKSSPAIVSSGVGSTKLSQNERKLLLKHAGLDQNIRTNLIKESKDNLIRQRAGIKNSTKNKARQVVSDLEIKKRLTK